MAVQSIGAVANLNPDLTFKAHSVELRITNTTAAPLTPIVVNVYSSPGSGPTGTAAVLYFTTTFAIGAPNGVVTLTIPTFTPSYSIRVSSPAAAGFISDVSLYAQGRDAAGELLDDQVFPFGEWRFVTAI